MEFLCVTDRYEKKEISYLNISLIMDHTLCFTVAYFTESYTFYSCKILDQKLELLHKYKVTKLLNENIKLQSYGRIKLEIELLNKCKVIE